MAAYFSSLANVSIPICMACLLGCAYQHYKSPDSRGLAELSLFILAPCLIITSLAESPHHGDSFLRVLAFIVLHSALCWIASAFTGRLFRLSPSSQRAVDMTTMFGNAVNYGLPLTMLAFHAEGFPYAVTYVVCQIMIVNTLGMYIAARSSFQPHEAFRQFVRIPLIYACAAGILLYGFRIPISASLQSGLKLLGNAYPAVVLLILGMQLRKIKWKSSTRKEVRLAVALRILVVPLLAWLCIKILGLHGLEASVLFVQSSMPAAVNALVLIEKYEGDTETVALTVGFTTAASFVYLPFFIGLAKGL